MIEVERKFRLTPEVKEKIVKEAKFVDVKEIHDAYWDTKDWALTLKCFWLRKRGERFELKVPLYGNGLKLGEHFSELEDDSSIASELGLPTNVSLGAALKEHGYFPFIEIFTTRTAYSLGEFAFDFDEGLNEYGDKYSLLEIERMVKKESEMKDAIDSIEKLANKFDVPNEHIYGKIGHFLKLRSPKHFAALIVSGAITEVK